MAIEISGVKHACASCIRGHRVKKCNHVEREMIPIPKRGRQISQCNHCRNLRKTHHTHVKCTCATSKVPNPMNGCLCEIVNNCTCVAHHLQDTSNISSQSNNIPDIPLRSSPLSSSSSSSSSPESPLFRFDDMFDLTPPMISSSSSSSCCSSNSNNSIMNSNDNSTITATDYNNMTMLSPTDKPLMSLSVSELLDLPIQFTVKNDVDLTSALQMQNSF